MPQLIQLSVRSFAEFLLRSGSIDSRFSGLDRGAQGTRLHRRLQKQGGKNYAAEVPLSMEETLGDFTYKLSGRVDGIIAEKNGIIVDEIKTVAVPLETLEENTHPAHWGQGCIYAHILCCQRELSEIAVQLTYCQVETGEIRRFVRTYTSKELQDFFHGLLRQYERWARLTVEWKQKRDASLRALSFPFAGYRKDQRKLAVASYTTFKEGGRLFCCAPTGIGKTISTLFPAMKALGEGYGERIFYFTAKTITRKAAEEALTLLRRETPIAFHSLTLTAKDKICMLEERACLPEMCPWANGYYDRVNDAVYEILQQQDTLSREVLEAAAQKYRLCPYELSLDLALWCDCVICDYNYLFDPVVHLQRFFEGKGGEYLFLVDEAHNLVERSREMYSAQLQKSGFYTFKKALPKKFKRMHTALSGLNSAFVQLRRVCEEGLPVRSQKEMPQELEKPLAKFLTAAEIFLEENRGSEWEQDLLALYFEVLFYTRIAEEYADNYITLIFRRGAEVTVRLFCLDPSAFLAESLSLGRAAVLFSATLQPLPYYKETLGGGENAKLLNLGSPFLQQNLGLFVADGVSTKYADRERSLAAVLSLLAQMVRAKPGNYIAYFPSYAYMMTAWEAFSQTFPDIETLVQRTGMEESAREDFLAAFSAESEKTLLGFCVLGGIFAEGVDLAGDRLIGTAVVGVGLPQIGPVPDALYHYYDEINGHGFEYAYQFPGMNKVLQAAGRVIRTERDRGVVLLIDSRFTSRRYQELFPAHWGHWQRIEEAGAQEKLLAFWQQEGE